MNQDMLRISSIVSNLVSIEWIGTSAVVAVPVLYPSGASAVVNISKHGDRYFVSDMGYGYQEAEMIGASGSFLRFASKIAEQYGIRFDNQSFFVAEATEGQLGTVITLVSNCSVESANHAAMKSSEKKYADETNLLYSKLVSVFSKEKVTKNAEVIGSSSHHWPVAALVSLNEHKAIFEPVSNHHNSVVNASAKFHDIARLESAPSRISIVQSKSGMKDYINLLAQSSKVIEASANSEIIRKAAA